MSSNDPPLSVNRFAPAEMYGAQGSPVDLRSMLGAVLRRWKLVTTVPVLALALTYGVMKAVPPVYKSTVEILIFDPQRQIEEAIQKRISPFTDAVDAVAMNTELEVIKSKSLALRVARELGLDNDEEFQPGGGILGWAERFGLPVAPLRAMLEELGILYPSSPKSEPQGAGDLGEQRLDRAAEMLRKRLDVSRVALSYVLAISVSSGDPAKARRLAATVADDYLASQREARQEALQKVATWLGGRVDDLRSRVLETEASIEKLKVASGLGDTGTKGNISEQQVSELNGQLMLVRAEVAEKKAHLEQARHLAAGGGEIQEIPEVMSSGLINQLRLQLSELSRREWELRSKLGERHAEVLAARLQLAGINRAISAEAERFLGNMQNAYDTAVRREHSLEASLQNLLAARGNSENYLKLQQLRRVADADRKLYESYLSQFNEISTRRSLQDASARIITPAGSPEAPNSRRMLIIYGFAGIFGFGAGLGLALLLEFLQAGIKTGAEVERSFGYPVVGVIPFAQSGKYRRWSEHQKLVQAIVDAPLSQFSEAVRATRIGLELSHVGQVPKVILITSSIPGEGKSAAAMLLAASSAKSGHATVLVDCDLRYPSTSNVFGRTQPGLSELLRGTAKLVDVIYVDPVTDTCVIPAGSIVPNPADLLMSQRMHDLITQLRDTYDYVVVDAPPLLPVIDAMALATLVDKILVVVEWGRTPRVSVSEAFKVLRPEAHRIAGVVLNKVDLKELQSYRYNARYHHQASSRYYSNT
jgi:exopolysaccharide transport family protein